MVSGIFTDRLWISFTVADESEFREAAIDPQADKNNFDQQSD
jgi:hypothetical protein